MKVFLVLVSFFGVQYMYSQVDYSDKWEDFYSYNNVKEFIKVEQKLYALSENAVFIYDINTKNISKLSSVNGLSGSATSAIYYSQTFKKLIIGYDNGGIDIVNENNKISIANSIINFSLAADKRINHMIELNGKLYISTSFAIVVFDLQKLEFGETLFIANNAAMTKVNQIEIFQNMIYAATENGIYKAAVNNPNLIDFNQWSRFGIGNYQSIKQFNNELYTSNNNILAKIMPNNTFISVKILPANIKKLQVNDFFLTATTQKQAFVYDINFNEIASPIANTNFNFNLNTASVINNLIYLGTSEFGILESQIQNQQSFNKIHPDGPNSNQPFSDRKSVV